jgi:hypothetical protein
MTRTLSIALLCCSVSLAGCVIQTDPDSNATNPFEGTYQVTRHTSNDMDCNGAQTDVTDGDKFFSLKEESLLGTPFLSYRSCTGATTCDESASLFLSFIDEGDGWVREIKTSSGSGTSCSLSYIFGPLVETETGLSIETRTQSGSVMLGTGETCDTDLAEARKAELPCTGIEFLSADKL